MSKASEISKTIDEACMAMIETFAMQYQKNPKNFLTCFLKFKSIRTNCEFIVRRFKASGVFEECKKCGKDFTEYANRQNIDEKCKSVLADTLLIIYYIISE